MLIDGRAIGVGKPTYIIAEFSANHHQRFDEAVRLVHAAHDAGADAVKLQTYTADTMTIPCDSELFRVKGTLWDGRNLHDLYQEAYTPWEWQPKLKALANELGMHCFSTPFDETSVEFLEDMGVPAYKIASFELVDLPFIEYVARKGKPIIISTGMGTLAEITEAVDTARGADAHQIALLKCTSAYPSPPADMNLRTIPHLGQTFDVPVGLSDHTLGIAAPIAAVSLGACIIEKHFTLSRNAPGPDSAFSLEPHEFRAMVEAIRSAEQSLGSAAYGLRASEQSSRVFRRSLFVTKDVKAGEPFTTANVRSIRPGHGLPPKHLTTILSLRAACDIERGTPLSWELVAGSKASDESPDD